MNKLETLNEMTYSKDLSLNESKKLLAICIRYGISDHERAQGILEFKEKLGDEKTAKLAGYLGKVYGNGFREAYLKIV